jgi:WD40 repeat protein
MSVNAGNNGKTQIPDLLKNFAIVALLLIPLGAYSFGNPWRVAEFIADTRGLGRSVAINSRVDVAAFGMNGELVATSDTSFRGAGAYPVHIWRTSDGTEISHTRPVGVSQIQFSGDGSHFAVAGNEGAWLFTTKDARVIWHEPSSTSFFSVAFSPDGTLLAYGGIEGRVQVLNIAQRKPVETYFLNCWIESIAFYPDGNGLAAGCGTPRGLVYPEKPIDQPNPIYLIRFDVSPPRKLVGHLVSSSQLAFSNDGSSIVSGGFDGSLKLWDTNSGHLLSEFLFTCPSGKPASSAFLQVRALAIDNDRKRIIASSDCDQQVELVSPTLESIKQKPYMTTIIAAIARNNKGETLTIDSEGHLRVEDSK